MYFPTHFAISFSGRILLYCFDEDDPTLDSQVLFEANQILFCEPITNS